MKEGYLPYERFFEGLDLRQGEVVILSADLTRIHYQALKYEKSFDPKKFVEGIREKIGPEGTLLIPAFNFTLRSEQAWDLKNTLPISGALSRVLMKAPEFQRTGHPLHSFLVWGRHADALAALNNKSSFGPDSPFAFLHDQSAKMVIVGMGLQEAFTFVHYVEECERVRYRKEKKVKVRYVNAEGERSVRNYTIFAKRSGMTMNLAPLEKELSSVMEYEEQNGVPIRVIPLQKAFEVIREDIRNNKARSLVQFRWSFFFRDLIKTVLRRTGSYRTKTDKIIDAAHRG